MIFYSPAKINLGLQVLRKRNDGYHDIASMMIPVPLYDIIEIIEHPEQSEKVKLKTTGLEIDIDPENNLITKAYEIFPWEKPRRVYIHLHKQIPVGAGLGGGSSNAATTLKGLNTVSGIHLGNNGLESFAAKLGSDCALFIENKPSLATGRGEKLSAVDLSLNNHYLVILNPGIHISTAEAYKQVVASENRPSLDACLKKPIHNWRNEIFNDFEDGIFLRYPRIREMKEALYNYGAIYASMSGSGSSVYGIFQKNPQIDPQLGKHLVWEGVIHPS